MKRLLICLALTFAAGSLHAQLPPVDATRRPACVDGRPWTIWLLNESSATDCDTTAGGTAEAFCCCKDGAVAACSSGGAGGNSFETMNAPAGTDPVADSSADTLNLTASGGLTITGNSGTDTLDFVVGNVATATALAANPGDCSGADNNFAWRINTSADLSCMDVVFPDSCSMILDIGDDGGNDSTGLIEFSTLNDDYAAFAEPSADEAQLDFAKVPPYKQYDPMRPPSTCAQCDEFTGGVTLTFNGWQNQESSTATAERDGLTIAHPTDATGIAAYWLTGPDGSSTNWAMHTRISTAHAGGTNEAGLILLVTGTEGTPTLMYMVMVFASSSTTSTVGVRSMTSYTSAQTLVGTDFNGGRSGFISIGYVSSTKRLSFYFSEDGYNFRALAGVTLGAHPKTSMGLMTASLSASLPSSGHFNFLRIRTDAGRLEVGE